jgi:transposase
MATTRRKSTPEFKAEAVKLVTDHGKSLAEVARDLDLGESMLRARKAALAQGGEQAFPGKGNPPAPEEELRRPRAEVKRLTMERDILPLNASIAVPSFSPDSSANVVLMRART